ncbi:EAL domain-containing protein [Niveibacterium sp.]|uniref:bifunctional diguanylate cyclase/phosphodiesterase n=1 Tax=Niveibacterium sp. TaxID=2017444 RepID=UPI0035B235B3
MSDQHRSPRSLLFVPWIILVLGLALTYALQHNAREASRHELHDEFELRAAGIVDDIQRRMRTYEQVLEGASGLFAVSPQVEREQFITYVRALKPEGKYPGIQGVGFAQLIAPQDKARHVAAMRASGIADYDIRPAGERERYTAIVYLEPANWRNQRAIGYDMYAEPVRRAAMAAARDEERTRISGRVTLVQETKDQVQPGFLMYLPVYRPNAPHQTLDERRANHLGWVYAPFRMYDLMAGILGTEQGEVSKLLDLDIYDGDRVDAPALMYDSDHHAASVAAPLFRSTKTIPLFGQPWTIQVSSLPAFEARLASEAANILAIAGTCGSTLLALVVWLLASGRVRALTLAGNMTDELRASNLAQIRLNRALRLLSDCNTTLVHADDEYKLLAEVCRLCVDRGGYLMAWVGYAEHDDAKSVRPIAQSGYEDGYLDGVNISWADNERGRGPTGTAIRSGKTCVNQDVLTNPGLAPWREAAIQRGYRSSIALPLIGNTHLLGALTIYSRERDAFDKEEVSLLEELATDLAYGIVTLRTRADHAAAKEQVEFLANFDPLTQLPNRMLLRDRFEQAAQLAEHDGTTLAMLYLDLDHFQQINDSLGHEAGDKVLGVAVERLRHCVPTAATISRLGGDEFVILLPTLHDATDVGTLANAIHDMFADPVTIDGNPLTVSFSIGVSLYPNDGQDFDTLLKRADAAVDSAKEAGRDTYRFFERDMNPDLLAQMRITGALPGALKNREFLLHYQPQVDLHSGRIVGVEALVRWQHPVDGLIAPGRFIPLAERSGYIVQLGEWILREACRQANAWRARHEHAPIVAVNFSALQFSRGSVVDCVTGALAESGLPAGFLEVELTESLLLQDLEATMTTLHVLKGLGVKLSIDDFGTGYSSLAYLKQLAVDKLKIDQSFVRDMLSGADGESIVKAMIQLGHALDLEVIAEGVETSAQLAFLRAAGCDQAQGYLFGRPEPAAALDALLTRGVVPLP